MQVFTQMIVYRPLAGTHAASVVKAAIEIAERTGPITIVFNNHCVDVEPTSNPNVLYAALAPGGRR